MRKKYKLRQIKKRYCYTFEEISSLMNVHNRTVQIWKKEGLKVIDTVRPYLVMGSSLYEFLQKKLEKRRFKLKPDEFYCVKCRKPQRVTDNDVWLELTGKTIGKDRHREIIIKGMCDECLTQLNRFSHEGRIEEIKTHFDIINLEVLNNE